MQAPNTSTEFTETVLRMQQFRLKRQILIKIHQCMLEGI